MLSTSGNTKMNTFTIQYAEKKVHKNQDMVSIKIKDMLSIKILTNASGDQEEEISHMFS